jgi:signal peptidase I
MLHRVRLQRWLFSGLIAAMVLAFVRLLAVQGWFVPARVVSGSMAEHLLGEHYLVTCYECRYPFPFGVESPPPREAAVCPNCGFDRNKVRAQGRRRGQRVLIDRGAYWFSSPNRFDVVALDYPGHPGRLAVKRLVGLPGERLGIRDGELYVDGNLVRKSLAHFRRLAVVVHDDGFRTRGGPGIPDRWRAESSESGWQAREAGFEYRGGGRERLPAGPVDGTRSVPAAWDWLVYHHWRCYGSPYPRTAEAAVADNSGYNQGESRSLHELTDLVFSCRAVCHGEGELVVRVHDGWDWILLRLDPVRRRARVECGDRFSREVALPAEADPRSCEIAFGVLDEQIVLGVDQWEVLREALGPSGGSRSAVTQPFAVGVDRLEVTLTNLRILRDVYYLDPTNLGQTWELTQPLAANEYTALGDNPSLSEDSRQWSDGRIDGQRILGRILPLAW